MDFTLEWLESNPMMVPLTRTASVGTKGATVWWGLGGLSREPLLCTSHGPSPGSQALCGIPRPRSLWLPPELLALGIPVVQTG